LLHSNNAGMAEWIKAQALRKNQGSL